MSPCLHHQGCACPKCRPDVYTVGVNPMGECMACVVCRERATFAFDGTCRACRDVKPEKVKR